MQKLSYGQALLQCVCSPQAVHCIVGWPFPRFLEEKSVLSIVLVPVKVPGVGCLMIDETHQKLDFVLGQKDVSVVVV